MTITIDVVAGTQERLEAQARRAGKTLTEYVKELVSERGGDSNMARASSRNLGFARGLISMSEDFDAPMDDFKEYL